jgi:hypothetical protein
MKKRQGEKRYRREETRLRESRSDKVALVRKIPDKKETRLRKKTGVKRDRREKEDRLERYQTKKETRV